jgi:Ca2+-binding EF-hand superfamily protein
MHKFVYALIGLAAIAGTPSLLAQDKTGDALKKLLEKFDKDGDGKLNDEERTAARAALRKQAPKDDPEEKPVRARRTPVQIANDRKKAELEARQRQFELRHFDKNKDGKLSDEERQFMQEEVRKYNEQVRAEAIKQWDKNGDGKLDDSELAAARAASEKARADYLKMFDKDGNGKIDEKEREAVRAFRKKQYEELLAKYDENKDGSLSREEKDKAFAADGIRFGFAPGGSDPDNADKPVRRPPRPTGN